MLISPENKVLLIKRFKSFAWRSSMMILALGIQFTLDNLELLKVSPAVTVIAGLFLGELSKWLNTRQTA